MSTSKKNILRWIKLRGKRGQLLLAVALFACVGGVYYVYQSSAATCSTQNLQKGSNVDCVKQFQAAINVNQPGRLVEDGDYGKNTKLAAEDIQRFWGLQVDGIAGPKTADALCYGLYNQGKKLPTYCAGTTSAAAAAKPVQSAPSTPPTSSTNLGQIIVDTSSGCKKTTIIYNGESKTYESCPKQPTTVVTPSPSPTTPTAPPLPSTPPPQTTPTQNTNTVQVINNGSQVVNTGNQVQVGNSSSTSCSTVTLMINGVPTTYGGCANTNNQAPTPPSSSPTQPVTQPTQQAPPTITSTTECPTPRPTVREGNVHPCVKRAQEILNQINSAGLNPDGNFGPKTKTAVINYQKLKFLAADGVIGNQTWTSLESGGVNNTVAVGTTPGVAAPKAATPKAPSKDSGGKGASVPAGTDCRGKVVDVGSKDVPCVKAIQWAVEVKDDGDFGGNTATAVKGFKQLRKLNPCGSSVVKGIVWDHIYNDELYRSSPGTGCEASSKTQPGSTAPEGYRDGSSSSTWMIPAAGGAANYNKLCVSLIPKQSHSGDTLDQDVVIHTKDGKFEVKFTEKVKLRKAAKGSGYHYSSCIPLTKPDGVTTATTSKSGWWVRSYLLQ